MAVILFLIRLAVTLIIVESRLKRSVQIDFLNKIAKIDMVLINKLGINLKYGQQHRFTFFRCVFAAFMFITTETIMIYSLEKNEEHIFEIFWILYTIPLLICSLQFQQIISYLCLVQHRYRSINEFIKYKCC